MLIFREFFKTQSDQNIHHDAPNCKRFSNFLQGSYHVYVPELPSLCVQQ